MRVLLDDEEKKMQFVHRIISSTFYKKVQSFSIFYIFIYDTENVTSSRLLIIKLNRFMINQFIIHVSSTNSFLIYRVFQYYEVCIAFPLHNRCRHYKTGDYK